MTKLTKPQYRLATIASVLGILEGTAWIFLSATFIGLFIATNYLEGRKESIYIVSPYGLMVFLWVYLITDSVWVVVSILQLRTINKTHSNCLRIFKCWGVITFLIAFIDLILAVLVGADYNENCIRGSGELSCTPALLVIAAKGFILWIVNVVFVYVFYRIIRTIESGKNLSRSLPSADPQIPRAISQPSTNNCLNQSNGTNQNNWSKQSAPYNNSDS